MTTQRETPMPNTQEGSRKSALRGLLCLLFAFPLLAAAEPALMQSPDHRAVELQQSDIEIRNRLQGRIDELAADEDATRKLIEQGKRRTILCQVCHGETGISPKPEVPNLAGQNPVYFVDQFQRFADGRRNDLAMSDLGRGLSEDDKIMLALYYAELESSPSGGGTAEEIARGERLYRKVCSECHGATGRGEKGYARLAGQQSVYVVNILKEFRDRTGRRFNPWMTAVSLHLSERDMQDLAFYIANMR